MFNKKPDTNRQGLEATIDDLMAQMSDHKPDSPEYKAMTENLIKLYALRDEKSVKSVSPDAILAVAGNLAGIAMIVGHERIGVVTSKALQFVMKAK
jgi:hypothetical protein